MLEFVGCTIIYVSCLPARHGSCKIHMRNSWQLLVRQRTSWQRYLLQIRNSVKTQKYSAMCGDVRYCMVQTKHADGGI